MSTTCPPRVEGFALVGDFMKPFGWYATYAEAYEQMKWQEKYGAGKFSMVRASEVDWDKWEGK